MVPEQLQPLVGAALVVQAMAQHDGVGHHELLPALVPAHLQGLRAEHAQLLGRVRRGGARKVKPGRLPVGRTLSSLALRRGSRAASRSVLVVAEGSFSRWRKRHGQARLLVRVRIRHK